MARRAALTQALAGGKNDADDRDQQTAPDRGGEELLEGFHQRSDDGRQRRYRGGFVGTMMFGHREVGIPLRPIVIAVSRQRLETF